MMSRAQDIFKMALRIRMESMAFNLLCHVVTSIISIRQLLDIKSFGKSG